MGLAFAGMPHKDIDRACQVVQDNLAEAPALVSLQYLYPQVYTINVGYRDSRGMPCLRIKDTGRMYFDTSAATAPDELAEFYSAYLANDLGRFGLRLDDAHGQLAMLGRLRQRRPEWRLVQFSLLGPVSMGLHTVDEKGKPLIYNDTFRDVITKSLVMLIRWYEHQVHQSLPGIPTLALVGEPSLQYYGSSLVPISKELITACLSDIKSQTRSLSCIHCCANTDWAMVMSANIDIISFDAYNYPDNLSIYASEVAEFLDKGGMLCWGIVPNTEAGIKAETADSLIEKLERGIGLLVKKGVSRQAIAEASFVQPSCNTVGVSPETCERILKMIGEVSAKMRARSLV